MGKIKKPVRIVLLLVVLVIAAGALYMFVLKKDMANKVSSEDTNKVAQDAEGKKTNPEEELKLAGDSGDAEASVKIINAAQLYYTDREYDKVLETLKKVPQTATTRILSLKYRLIADVYLAQNKQDKYLQTKAEYKALLASRAATDPLAKTALDAIDKTYPENMAPTVTYPEGQEQP